MDNTKVIKNRIVEARLESDAKLVKSKRERAKLVMDSLVTEYSGYDWQSLALIKTFFNCLCDPRSLPLFHVLLQVSY